MEHIFKEIRQERDRQGIKWGISDFKRNNPLSWVNWIVAEAVGWHSSLAYDEDGWNVHQMTRVAFRRAMIKVATVAVAAIQSIDEGN